VCPPQPITPEETTCIWFMRPHHAHNLAWLPREAGLFSFQTLTFPEPLVMKLPQRIPGPELILSAYYSYAWVYAYMCVFMYVGTDVEDGCVMGIGVWVQHANVYGGPWTTWVVLRCCLPCFFLRQGLSLVWNLPASPRDPPVSTSPVLELEWHTTNPGLPAFLPSFLIYSNGSQGFKLRTLDLQPSSLHSFPWASWFQL